MSELNKLALAYAQTLVEYNEMKMHSDASGLRVDQFSLREARDAMYDAQNALNAEAEKLAKETVEA